MAQSIDELKGMVTRKGGLANPTLFKVMLPSPSHFGVNRTSVRDLNLLCTGVSLPGRQVMTNERSIGGVVQKIANGTATSDINMNFRVMNDYGVKEYFEAWQNAAINQGTINGQETIEMAYAEQYQHQVKIQQLKKGFGIPIYQTALPLPKLPPEIQNRLPRIELGPFGNLDFAQGELDLDFQTRDQVVYECTLTDAFPTTMNEIAFSDASVNGLIEFNIQLSYRRWFRTDNGSSPLGAFGQTLSTIRSIVGL